MSRTTRRTTTAVAVLAASALLLGGCTAGTSDPEPTSLDELAAEQRENGALDPTPSAEQSDSPKDAAVEEAEAAVQEYNRVLNEALTDPTSFDVGDLKDVATSSALLDARNEYNYVVANDERQTGRASMEVLRVRKVDLRNEPKKKPFPVYPTVQLMVCTDASELDVVDSDGKSVLAPGVPPRRLVRVGLRNENYPNGPWLMSYGEQQEGKTC